MYKISEGDYYYHVTKECTNKTRMDKVENYIQLKPVISNVEPSGSATRQLQQLAITVYVTVQAVRFTRQSPFTAVIRNTSVFRVTAGFH